MTRSNFSYKINEEDQRLEIIDNFSFDNPTMSVTIDAENVLTSIREKIGEKILNLKVIAKDTDGNWDTLIPEWDGDECVNVKFKIGI